MRIVNQHRKRISGTSDWLKSPRRSCARGECLFNHLRGHTDRPCGGHCLQRVHGIVPANNRKVHAHAAPWTSKCCILPTKLRGMNGGGALRIAGGTCFARSAHTATQDVGGAAFHHDCAPRIVHVDHCRTGWRKPSKEQLLGSCIGFHGLVIIKVIARQIAENRGVKLQRIRAALIKCVTGNFHGARAATIAHHASKCMRQIDRSRSRQACAR